MIILRLYTSKKYAVKAWLISILIILLNISYAIFHISVTNWFEKVYNIIIKSLNTNDDTYIMEIRNNALNLPIYLVILGSISVFNSLSLSLLLMIWRNCQTNNLFHHWQVIRHIEGAAQRVQEDTLIVMSVTRKLFPKITMTFIKGVSHFPMLYKASIKIGGIPPFYENSQYALLVYVFSAIVLSCIALSTSSSSIPILLKKSQVTEASLRKDLVIGESYVLYVENKDIEQTFSSLSNIYEKLYYTMMRYELVSRLSEKIFESLPSIILLPAICSRKISLGERMSIIRCVNSARSPIISIVLNWDKINELYVAVKRLNSLEIMIAKHNTDYLLNTQ
ncbi:SbmA/BacA-like family protein [Cryptosporidium muris RN66]|uniref:SbmA/BacA-like family protein n=1 Tax=Cryptosporidium muris (strain RN66) TaxID=441375 RepID=B6AFG1_CRYMR|nr:SbmA/BacA-like family protein [Cryptosporidium muris RN66]EEA06952.1 SbmA/BacA-like family protein [Cryptosporidium muris RN66]|eukprot:XP_002141301.1 SbmA/BacA-like family protein [Cryptosporidium muris RN66]